MQCLNHRANRLESEILNFQLNCSNHIKFEHPFWFLTEAVSTWKLGHSPMTNQRVLVLNSGIIHGMPVLDVFLTPQLA